MAQNVFSISTPDFPYITIGKFVDPCVKVLSRYLLRGTKEKNMATLASPRTEPGSSVIRSRNANGFGVIHTQSTAPLKEDHRSCEILFARRPRLLEVRVSTLTESLAILIEDFPAFTVILGKCQGGVLS
jgi:hypothetical protein